MFYSMFVFLTCQLILAGMTLWIKNVVNEIWEAVLLTQKHFKEMSERNVGKLSPF